MGTSTAKSEVAQNTKQTEDVTFTSKIPDGGWGWVVVACGFFSIFVFLGIPVTFGIFFNEKLTAMDVSSSTTAWIYNFYIFNYFVSVTIAPSLCDVFGWRNVGFITGFVTALAYACMVFARGPGLVFVLFSVIAGYSSGIAVFIGLLAIPHYFDVHRGRAVAIVMVGVSVSQVVLPLLMRVLIDEYGFSGACLLFAGIILNCAACNLLFYPAHRRPIIKGDKMYDALKAMPQVSSGFQKVDNNLIDGSKLGSQSPGDTKAPHVLLKEFLRISWHNVRQLKHLKLLIVTLSMSLLFVGYGNFMALLPFAMATEGHLPAQTTYCLSYSSVASLFVRVFISVFADADWFSRKITYIAGAALAGVAALATGFVLHDTRWILTCLVFWNLGISANASVFFSLIIDTCGRKLYNAGTAVYGLLLAISSIIASPLIGIVSHESSYQAGIGMTAAFHIMCALIWIFMPLARRHDERKFGDQHGQDKEDEIISPEHFQYNGLRSKELDYGAVNCRFVVDTDGCSGRLDSVNLNRKSTVRGTL